MRQTVPKCDAYATYCGFAATVPCQIGAMRHNSGIANQGIAMDFPRATLATDSATAIPAVTPPIRRAVLDLPGPRPWPLFGNLLQMKSTRVHHDVEAWCRRFGPVFRILFGRVPILVVAQHELVNAILR